MFPEQGKYEYTEEDRPICSPMNPLYSMNVLQSAPPVVFTTSGMNVTGCPMTGVPEESEWVAC